MSNAVNDLIPTSTAKQAELSIVILAAGKGTRMSSDLPKVLQIAGGKPLINHVVETAQKLNPTKIFVVVGHDRKQVVKKLKAYKNIQIVVQEPQLGTGHAVQQVQPFLNMKTGNLMILSGDVPLLRSATLKQLIQTHADASAAATILTAKVEDPSGYGRVLRNRKDMLAKIIEHRDCTPGQLEVKEINAGIYLFDAAILFKALANIGIENAQGEYYLPAALDHFLLWGEKVALLIIGDPLEISGVNTFEQLSEINRIFSHRNEKNL
jgi:UDP-N-acetylglucosamine pyrophosphorylase